MDIDRIGVTADGVRIDVKDGKSIQQALYKHWKEQRLVNVTPDTPVLSIRRVLDGAGLAKMVVLPLKTGSFMQDFWINCVDLAPQSLVLAVHVVGGDLVRFRRFVIASDPRVPIPAEELDWKFHDEASSATARAWLSAPARQYEVVSLATFAELPFGEVANVLTRLAAIWPAASPLRLWFQEPAPIALHAPLTRRLNAATLSPAVIRSNVRLVEQRLYDCYLAQTDASSPPMTLVFTLHVAAAGTTTVSFDHPETTIENPDMLKCMMSNLDGMRFPERKGAEAVDAKHGFVFHPKSK
jgi:hypothetical protein